MQNKIENNLVSYIRDTEGNVVFVLVDTKSALELANHMYRNNLQAMFHLFNVDIVDVVSNIIVITTFKNVVKWKELGNVSDERLAIDSQLNILINKSPIEYDSSLDGLNKIYGAMPTLRSWLETIENFTDTIFDNRLLKDDVIAFKNNFEGKR